jgi:DNA polymerase-3 subunit beta
MEITVAKKDLLKLLARVGSVTERRSTMQALSNVLFTADGQELRLFATDNAMAMAGSISAQVHSAGVVALPAKDLIERVRMMPDGPVSLTTNERSIATLKAGVGARRYTVSGLPEVDFPAAPEVPTNGSSMTIAARDLVDLIAHAAFSVSTDESRPHLNSTLVEFDGEVVRMVSTDGHRLTKAEVTSVGATARATLLVPLKAVQELRRVCDDLLSDHGNDAKLTITTAGSTAFFSAGTLVFSVKLVEAQFPPYAQVIPKSSSRKVRASRAALADALRAVSIAASEKTGGVRLLLGEGVVRIASESPGVGEGFDELPVDYDGTPVQVGLNGKYLLEVLSALTEDEVTIDLNGELDPIIVRPVGDRSFLAVVMPMRI